MLPMSAFETFVTNYGYWALFIGTFLEGESVLIIGGLVAHLGYLQLPYVMLTAFIGSFLGDQSAYYLGYFKGSAFLSRYPKWQGRVDWIQKLIERYHTIIILGFRFIYGIRILTPFVLGAFRDVGKIRFSVLNACGAVLWSVIISAGGYFFGYALEALVKDVKRYELHAIVFIIAVALIVAIVHKLKFKKIDRNTK